MLVYNFLFFNFIRDLSDHLHYSNYKTILINFLIWNYVFFFIVIICLCIFCYKKNVDINNKILNYVPFFFFVVSFPVNLVTLPFCNIALSILFSLLFFFNFLILRITFILFVYIYNFIIIVYHSNKIFFCLPKNIVDFFVTIFLIYLGLRFYFDISILTSFCSDSNNNINNWSSKKKNTDSASVSSFEEKWKKIDDKYPYLKYVLVLAGFILLVCYIGVEINSDTPPPSPKGSGGLGNHPYNPFNDPHRYINRRIRPRHNPPPATPLQVIAEEG